MKTILLSISLVICSYTWSQQLPEKSSFTEITQQVGLNKINIKYSRPSVNERVIFGDLLPYGQVWRLGANEPTKIHISHPIFINMQKLDTGEYAVFAVPYKNYWNIVFNTDTKQWGASDYDAKKNVLEYQASVGQGNHTETFQISFDAVDQSSAVFTMQWDDVKVSVPFTTDTKLAVEQSIQTAIDKGENLSRVYSRAADHYIDENETEKAKKYLEKSIAIEKTHYNVFLSATLLKETDLKGAKKMAEEAATLAEKAEKQGWADYIRRKSGEWK